MIVSAQFGALGPADRVPAYKRELDAAYWRAALRLRWRRLPRGGSSSTARRQPTWPRGARDAIRAWRGCMSASSRNVTAFGVSSRTSRRRRAVTWRATFSAAASGHGRRRSWRTPLPSSSSASSCHRPGRRPVRADRRPTGALKGASTIARIDPRRLSALPALADLPAAELAELAAVMTEVEIEAGPSSSPSARTAMSSTSWSRGRPMP